MMTNKIFRVTGYAVEDGPVNMHCCYYQAESAEHLRETVIKGLEGYIIVDEIVEVTLQDVLNLINFFVY